MKRIILTLLLLVGLSIVSFAKDYKASTSKYSVEYTDTTTNNTYTIKSETYNVYKSKSGAFYIWKTSKKTCKNYKYYLPKDIQIEMGREYKDNNNKTNNNK